MANKRTFYLSGAFSVACAGLLVWATPSIAQIEAQGTAPPPPAATLPAAQPVATPVPPAGAENPLTVTNVLIDKTDKNAVMARDQAIIEAQRSALQKLAEKWMTPDELKVFKLPDDKTIATMVQDFEIKNEQLSADRYVASFTVRFNGQVRNYIKIPSGAATTIAGDTPSSAPAVTTPVDTPVVKAAADVKPVLDVPTGPRDVLVLPYFEDISGKKILWEDPNPWREAWQSIGNATPTSTLTITVPMGDLTDISSGNTDAVWSGDYSVLEKLRTNYGASEVALMVANKSGVNMKIDMYSYHDGKLEREKTIVPYTTVEDPNAMKDVVAQVTKAIQSPEAYVDVAAKSADDKIFPPPATMKDKDKTVEATATQAMGTSAPAAVSSKPEKAVVDASMNFTNFTQWLEVQRRLSALSSSLTLEISSLSKNAAHFTITYNNGLDGLKTALAGKGLALNEPSVQIDPSVLGKDKPVTQPHEIYELKFVN